MPIAKEKGEANESLKQDWTDGNEQQIGIFCLAIGKVILNDIRGC